MKPEYLDESAIILGSTDSKKSDTGSALLELLDRAKESSDHLELLKIALVQRDDFPSTKRPLSNHNTLTSERWDELNQYHLAVVLSHLKLSFVNSDSADAFAKKCYGVVDLFDNREERVFTLSTILYSPYVPFRQIVGAFKSVSDKEYNELLQANQELADDLIYVERLPFEDLPSECLNVLNVLNKTEDAKMKVALLSLYASNLIRRYKKNR